MTSRWSYARDDGKMVTASGPFREVGSPVHDYLRVARLTSV